MIGRTEHLINDPHFIGVDKFVLFFGVVEDRDDPLQLGRVRIRIFGVHPDDKSLVATEDLPWSFPIMPITAPQYGGVGSGPVGIMPGSTVVGFFADGLDRQIPMHFGTMSGGTGHFAAGANGDAANMDPATPYNPDGISGSIDPKSSMVVKGVQLGKILLSNFASQGLKPHHAAAICGNLGEESGGFPVPAIHERGKGVGGSPSTPPSRSSVGVGYGWGQWTNNNRLTKFLDWCDKYHLEPSDQQTQIKYFTYEITTVPPYSKHFQTLMKGGTATINNTRFTKPNGTYNLDDVDQATAWWMWVYEVPGAPNLAARQKIARSIRDQLVGGSAGSSVRTNGKPEK